MIYDAFCDAQKRNKIATNRYGWKMRGGANAYLIVILSDEMEVLRFEFCGEKKEDN